MDVLLCVFRGARPLTQLRQYALLWHGICGNWRNGLGMDHKLDLHTVHCYGYGRTLLEYANQVGQVRGGTLENIDSLIAVAFTMLLQFLRQKVMVRSQLGSPAGVISWSR
jgi:hypothetical protein